MANDTGSSSGAAERTAADDGRTVGVYLDGATLARLDAVAGAEGRSRSNALVRLLAEALDARAAAATGLHPAAKVRR